MNYFLYFYFLFFLIINLQLITHYFFVFIKLVYFYFIFLSSFSKFNFKYQKLNYTPVKLVHRLQGKNISYFLTFKINNNHLLRDHNLIASLIMIVYYINYNRHIIKQNSFYSHPNQLSVNLLIFSKYFIDLTLMVNNKPILFPYFLHYFLSRYYFHPHYVALKIFIE